MEVSEIIEQVDILEYISQFCELEQRTDGEYWGLSPIKEENTPSFSVNVEKQRFYDFSSGAGGNVLDFIKAYHRCDFYKGLRILKEYANIDEDSEELHCTRLLATSIAKKYKSVRQKEREFKAAPMPDNYMDRYEDPGDKLSAWEREGITKESAAHFLVRYDRFSNRLVFPIRDVDGCIINVCGRTLDPDFKTKHLRKYTYFKPLGALDTIYGLSENREDIIRKKEIILFEGSKSVMIANGWGIKNTGAILTSHLNPLQFKILIRLGVRVVFALDADVDIRKDSNIMRLLPYAQVEWVRNRRNLLDGKDAPVDKGLEIFTVLYDERSRLK